MPIAGYAHHARMPSFWKKAIDKQLNLSGVEPMPPAPALKRLSRGPVSTLDLARPFDMALPSFTQHLSMLERFGLVKSRKSGRVRTFELAPKRLQTAEDWITDRRKLWEQRLDQLDAYATCRRLSLPSIATPTAGRSWNARNVWTSGVIPSAATAGFALVVFLFKDIGHAFVRYIEWLGRIEPSLAAVKRTIAKLVPCRNFSVSVL
jgi:DNA-binding transcriptional ArsR family regulator